MNKTTCQMLKVLLVISFCINNLYGQERFKTDDYIILDKILKKNPENNFLVKKCNNNYVIEQIKLLNYYEKNKDYKSLDSLKQVSGISDDILLNSKVFIYINYENFINQVDEKSNWNKMHIEHNINFHDAKGGEFIFVSKPIYTIDEKIAIVNVSTPNKNFIQIYIKGTNSEWVEYKIVFVKLF